MSKLKFDDNNVDVLLGLEGIRKRTDMYIGSYKPVLHCCQELFDNVVDEFNNDSSTTMKVTIDTNENSIIVEDTGRGIPLGINKKLGIPTLEVLTTYIHAGSKFDKNSYQTSAGKNGVGIKACSAVGELFEVSSYRDGEKGSITISQGKVIEPFKKSKIKNKKKHGVTAKFIPDSTLFDKEDVEINPKDIREKLELKAYLNAGLKIIYTVDDNTETMCYNYGLSDFLDREVKKPLYEMKNIIINETDDDGNIYEIALTWEENEMSEKILGFTNSIPNESGTHMTGFRQGITQVFTDYIKENNMLTKKDKDLDIRGEDVRLGLVAIINLKHNNPLYNSQSKTQLTNKEIVGIMKKIILDNMKDYFRDNPKLAKSLATRVLEFSRSSYRARENKKKIVSSSSNLSLSLPSKFKDCNSNNPDEVEIFIIEGDSAASSTEAGRFSEFQCIFPLRGKIKNTHDVEQGNLINNQEINNFLKVEFGTNDVTKIKKAFADGTVKVKSKKLIILTDADVDGAHIANLFINFIFCHLPEIIDNGWLYIGIAPLYRVLVGKTYKYLMNNKEWADFTTEIIGKRYKITNDELTLKKVMFYSDSFLEEYNRILDKYSLTTDLLDVFTNLSGERKDDLKELYLTFKEEYDNAFDIDKKHNVSGLYNNLWIAFNIDELYDETISLRNIYPENYLSIYDKTTKEEDTFYIKDGIDKLKKEFKYIRNRLKGLGEMDGEELRETTLDPDKRTLIKVQSENADDEIELCKILFGKNSDLRKKFIQDYI